MNPSERIPRIDRCARIMIVIVAVALVFSIIRVGQLKLAPRPELLSSQGARKAMHFEPRYRGAVFDRNGRTLAIDRPAWRLAIDPDFFINHGYERMLENAGSAPDPSIGIEMDHDMADLVGPLWLIREHARTVRFARLASTLEEEIGLPRERTLQALQGSSPGRRYLVLDRLLDSWQVDVVRSMVDGRKIGLILEQRTIRAFFGPQSLRMIVGKVRENGQGGSGLEQNRNMDLQSKRGVLHTRRTSQGQVISIPKGSYDAGEHGSDCTLTIDAHIQSIVEERLGRQLDEYNAGGGRCLVVNPRNGEILAMVDILRRRGGWEEVLLDDPMRRIEPSLARNRNMIDAFEPGSTFKPYIWAGAVEAGVGSRHRLPRDSSNRILVNMKPVKIKGRRTTVKDAGTGNTQYKGPIKDIETILIRSLNTGMVEMVRPLSNSETRDITLRFGFGQRTGCGIAGTAEHPGQVTSLRNWSYGNTSVSVSFGHEVAVTTPQMARAFSAFCNEGLMPQLRITMPGGEAPTRDPDGLSRRLMTRAVSPIVAERTKDALRRVVEEGTLSRHARSEKYTMFGKSGTADLPNPEGGYFKNRHTSNVIAGAPFEQPRLVVFCVIDDPDKSIGYYGGQVAGPVVKDVIDASLEYMGVRADILSDELGGDPRFASSGGATDLVGGE